MATRFIVYGLTDPRTDLIRYIGLSTRGLERPRQHAHPSRVTERTPKACWVRSLLRRDLMYRIVVLAQYPDASVLPEAERCWIEFGKSKGWPLLNATDGGEGALNPCEETRAKMRAAKLGTKRPPRSAEWRARLSLALRKPARPPKLGIGSPELRAVLSEAARRQWAKQARAVVNVTTGDTYPSQRAAALALGVTSGMIGHALHGRSEQVKGQRLRFA